MYAIFFMAVVGNHDILNPHLATVEVDIPNTTSKCLWQGNHNKICGIGANSLNNFLAYASRSLYPRARASADQTSVRVIWSGALFAMLADQDPTMNLSVVMIATSSVLFAAKTGTEKDTSLSCSWVASAFMSPCAMRLEVTRRMRRETISRLPCCCSGSGGGW